MSTILTADDLEPGLHVAVHGRRQPLRMQMPRDGDDDEVVIHHSGGMATPPAGVPLRIIELALPFAACAVIEPGNGEAGPIIVDTREVHLMRLPTQYVDAIVGFGEHDTTKADRGHPGAHGQRRGNTDPRRGD